MRGPTSSGHNPLSIFLDSVRVRAGVFFSGEPKSGENLGENLGSAMASGYGISTLHCTTVSLAHGGMGLGSAFGPKKYEGLVKEAGFLSFDTVGSNPMNNFCERRLSTRPVRSCFALSNWRRSCRRDQGRYRHPGVAVRQWTPCETNGTRR